MQSDTVIGIIGAVVLVGVMVGVFAYEYNNVDSDDEPTEAEERAMQQAAFNETFGALDPDGDLDGDGTPNYAETDLDDDGIPNEEDDRFQFERSFDAGGAVSGAPSFAGYALNFEAEEGLGHVMLRLSHDERLAADQTVLALNVQLTANGETRSATAVTSGGVTTYTLDLEDVGPGTYALSVTPFAVAGVSLDPGTTVTGSLEFHYFA